jgi:ribonucleotide monophosphatase NagD (HAD superfamily)
VNKTTVSLTFFLGIKALFLANFYFLGLSRLLLDGAPLIAIHKARYYKRKDGLALGPGPFVTALEYATDTKAIVVGKPEKTFFLEALRDTGCAPEEAVMIGDVSRRVQKVP